MRNVSFPIRAGPWLRELPARRLEPYVSHHLPLPLPAIAPTVDDALEYQSKHDPGSDARQQRPSRFHAELGRECPVQDERNEDRRQESGESLAQFAAFRGRLIRWHAYRDDGSVFAGRYPRAGPPVSRGPSLRVRAGVTGPTGDG